MVLVTATSMAETMHVTLDRQYYDQLAREAAESGMAMAETCLEANGYVPSWSGSYPLQPDKDCTGMNNNGISHWIVNNDYVRTTFSAAFPTNNNVSQNVTVTGTVELLEKTSGLPWRVFTHKSTTSIGVDLSFNTVAFGYAGGHGAYFGTITVDNVLRMVGYNEWGQLGNGTYDSTLTPTEFHLNGSDIPVSVFTNFLSGGYNVFVLTNHGEVWGSGYNYYGQLGNGTKTTTPNAVKFSLPVGKTAKHVTLNGFDTYVLTTDGNLYSTGMCTEGLLGYNYAIDTCTHQSTYHRVNLPAVTADPNTIPTTNITTDHHSTFVRMQGGRVYGWGANSNSIFGGYSNVDTSNPVQIGTFGNTGQPTAKQIFTDGVSLWIVDSNGAMWGTGYNQYGQLGGGNITIYNAAAGHCLDNKNADSVTLWLYDCNGSPAQQFTFQTDGTIYNANRNVCVDNTNHSSANQAPIRLAVCDGSTAQKWQMRADGSIRNPTYGTCIDNRDADGFNLQLYACLGNVNQTFSLSDQAKLIRFNLPAQGGTVSKVWTDQWFVTVLTSNGQVWGAGLNDYGQLGNGSTSLVQPYPVKFILPNGVTATDLYVTCSGPTNKYCNTFVIGSNGKVYGAGSNYFGQLGDGTTTNRSTPVAMQVIDGAINHASQVMSGYGTTVILTTNHKVFTVGNNSDGQLGNGTTTNSSIPSVNKYTNVLPVTSF